MGSYGHIFSTLAFEDLARIQKGSPTLTTFFMSGERIQIPLKAGHHLTASETPLKSNVGLVAL